MIEQAQEGERENERARESKKRKLEPRERESRRRKRENARFLDNSSTLISRAFVNTPWDASAPGD